MSTRVDSEQTDVDIRVMLPEEYETMRELSISAFNGDPKIRMLLDHLRQSWAWDDELSFVADIDGRHWTSPVQRCVPRHAEAPRRCAGAQFPAEWLSEPQVLLKEARSLTWIKSRPVARAFDRLAFILFGQRDPGIKPVGWLPGHGTHGGDGGQAPPYVPYNSDWDRKKNKKLPHER